jgi:hypothetical protein
MWRRDLSKEVLEERAAKNKRRNVRRKNERHKKQAIRIMGQRAHKAPLIRQLINETVYYNRCLSILLRRLYDSNIEEQQYCLSMIKSRRDLLLKIAGVREVKRCE